MKKTLCKYNVSQLPSIVDSPAARSLCARAAIEQEQELSLLAVTYHYMVSDLSLLEVTYHCMVSDLSLLDV